MNMVNSKTKNNNNRSATRNKEKMDKKKKNRNKEIKIFIIHAGVIFCASLAIIYKHLLVLF